MADLFDLPFEDEDDERLGIDWNIKITASGAKRPITFPFDYFDVESKYLDKFSPLVQTGQDVARN